MRSFGAVRPIWFCWPGSFCAIRIGRSVRLRHWAQRRRCLFNIRELLWIRKKKGRDEVSLFNGKSGTDTEVPVPGTYCLLLGVALSDRVGLTQVDAQQVSENSDPSFRVSVTVSGN